MTAQERRIVKMRDLVLTGLDELETALVEADRMVDAQAVNLMKTQLPMVAAVDGE